MSDKREFTGLELETAKEMKARGFTWKELGAKFKCAPPTIRCRLDPEFKKKVVKWEKNKTVAKRRIWEAGELVREEPKEFFQKPLEVQPVPTTLDQIMFGDPMPGRSALDQQRVSGVAH